MRGEVLCEGEWPVKRLEYLIEQLSSIRAEMSAVERRFSEDVQSLHDDHHESAINLLHYLVLRRHDLRALQEQLAGYGLSSLGRGESHVASNIDAVLKVLLCMAHRPFKNTNRNAERAAGSSALEYNTAALLGPAPLGRTVRIMVTMPSEAASNYALIEELLAGGMNCMRVNGAHDDQDAWAHMIENLRRAERALDKQCSVLIDLPGPKLRTGNTEWAPGVIKLNPKRDRYGNVIESAKICITSADTLPDPNVKSIAILSLPADWLSRLEVGDKITFLDARGMARSMKITGAMERNLIAEADRTSYITADTVLQCSRLGKNGLRTDCRIGSIPESPQPIVLKSGDLLDLLPPHDAVGSAARDKHGNYVQPPAIGVTLPEIFADVRTGEKIWFDDGKIGGIIRSVEPDKIRIEITKARAKGEKLRADKGINLPDSDLKLPALTNEDVALLPFVARNADLVGYSFVRRPSDIYRLQTELAKIGGANLGVILKIETRKAFESLPRLILTAMRSARVGVMIARGDLAVECGYERTGEIQEEIMWIAEAARVPVTWATQVLESLAKKGQPSRAEITDAAMAERAECVMLNKGPYVVEAVKMLDDVLRRMQHHQAKKFSLLRPLTIAENFV
ncbi:MAG TPA: pyruvate kinase [Acidobacteriota bacterium]|nr:pyruvate kinase [Acidobacteriota bacterium]